MAAMNSVCSAELYFLSLSRQLLLWHYWCFCGPGITFLIPLVFVTDPQQYTLPLFVSTLGGSYRVDYAAKMLNLTLAIIPVLIFFSIFSKYLIKGMTIGAIKE